MAPLAVLLGASAEEAHAAAETAQVVPVKVAFAEIAKCWSQYVKLMDVRAEDLDILHYLKAVWVILQVLFPTFIFIIRHLQLVTV